MSGVFIFLIFLFPGNNMLNEIVSLYLNSFKCTEKKHLNLQLCYYYYRFIFLLKFIISDILIEVYESKVMQSIKKKYATAQGLWHQYTHSQQKQSQ